MNLFFKFVLLGLFCVGLYASAVFADSPQKGLSGTKAIELTEAELDWIVQNPVIQVGADAKFPPFEYLDHQSKQPVGLSLAYLKIIGARTGLKFEVTASEKWRELMQQVENKELHLLSGAVVTERRLETLHFTRPYANFPLVITVRENSEFVGSMRNLYGKKVAVVAGFAEEDLLRSKYPWLELISFDSRREALLAVSTGSVTAFIGNVAIISYLIRSENLDNLQIAAPASLDRVGLSMASANPILVSILDKALATLTPQEQNALEQEWIAVKFQNVDYVVFGKLGAALLGVLLVTMIWIFTLKKQILNRKHVELELIEARQTAEVAMLRAEAANARKSEFMGIAAHDLKNPLSSIRGLASIIHEDLKASNLVEPAKTETVDMIVSIEEVSEHMLALVNELLDVEAIESGLTKGERAQIDLTILVEEVIEFNRLAASKKSIRIEFTAPNAELTVYAELFRLREILDNIINNAVKYSPHGSLIDIRMEAVESSSKVLFKVLDQGPGLTEDDLVRLFERFARCSATPTAGESSTGLGMSIVKTLVEQVDGRVWAENRTNEQGSAFIIELPCCSRDTASIST